MAVGQDFARKLDLVLKTLNLSRGRLAQYVGVDKSVVSRWASGATVPTDHNLSLLTEAVTRHKADFGRHDWDLALGAFAARLGLAGRTVSEGAAVKPPAPERPAIAVLPFANIGGDREQEYFADGITEDIITALSKWRSFLVIARNSTFTFKGRSVDPREVGRELGARYILEGSVRLARGDGAGRKIRITVQLIDAGSAAHLWAERYDRDLVDIFAIQDEVTQSVASAIEPALTQSEHEIARHKPPESMAAWDYCLRGSWHFHRFGAAEAEQAMTCYGRAIELDGDLVEGHVGVARVAFSQAMYGYPTVPPLGRDDLISIASAAARRALALDSRNALAYYILSLAAAHTGDPQTAVGHGRQAVLLNPSLSVGYFALAVASLFAGEPLEALGTIDTALRLSPNDPQKFAWLAQRASALYLCRRYDEAVEAARQSLAIRWFQTACRVLAAGQAQLGRKAQARAALDELLAAEGAESTIALAVRHFQRAADRELYAEGLSKAGMSKG